MEEAIRFFIDHIAWAIISVLFGWIWKTNGKIIKLQSDLTNEVEARVKCETMEHEFKNEVKAALSDLHEKINPIAMNVAFIAGLMKQEHIGNEGERRR